jgi:hypothetical protein
MGDQREQLIEKLVNTGHLSVPERLALGSTMVYSSEIAAIVTRVLNDTGSFPQNAKSWQQGHVVYEGGILHKSSGGKIRLVRQRSHPIAPAVLADQKATDFDDVQSAVKAFMRSEWPKDIDGVRIVWDS